MKLNLDCMRDVMLFLEDTHYGERILTSSLCNSISGYSDDDICYTCLKLCQAGFISGMVVDYNGGFYYVKDICDITYEGHQFLANIHSDTVWNNVKEVASSIGAKSVPAITRIAANVITALIHSKLGI